MNVRVNLGERSYDIVVVSNDLGGVGPFARQRTRGSLALVVTDPNVPHAAPVATALRSAGIRAEMALVPPAEASKSLEQAALLYDRLADLQADRKTLIVAVGGGVVGDLAGFVAATFARGLPLLMVPTTLLAMVDSAVGGKVGVNHRRAKNLIGAFHQPVGVWADTATLATLPDREYRSGLAEVVKYGVSLDADFFAWLEAHAEAILQREPELVRQIVARCCRLKADIVEQDEREETGRRAVLNYGHTFAHAFEIAAGYGAWLHGEAVAAGMVCAAKLAVGRGLIARAIANRQEKLLTRLGLPTAPGAWSVDDQLATMHSDKKAVAGRMRFVLPVRLGEATLVDDVSEAEVREVLSSSTAK